MKKSTNIQLLPAPGAATTALAFALLAGALALGAGLAPALAWLLLGAPLLEELVFRLGLQEALLRRLPQHGSGLANLVTALAFAGAHTLVRPGWMAAATLLPALAIGLLYGRTRRLAPCVLAHATFNLVGLVVFGLPNTP